MMIVDVDDTRECPVADECTSCGTTTDLAVTTADTAVGVLCVTACRDCITAHQPLPNFGVQAAMHAVLAHCEHLGIDLDEMADSRNP